MYDTLVLWRDRTFLICCCQRRTQCTKWMRPWQPVLYRSIKLPQVQLGPAHTQHILHSLVPMPLRIDGSFANYTLIVWLAVNSWSILSVFGAQHLALVGEIIAIRTAAVRTAFVCMRCVMMFFSAYVSYKPFIRSAWTLFSISHISTSYAMRACVCVCVPA